MKLTALYWEDGVGDDDDYEQEKNSEDHNEYRRLCDI